MFVQKLTGGGVVRTFVFQYWNSSNLEVFI